MDPGRWLYDGSFSGVPISGEADASGRMRTSWQDSLRSGGSAEHSPLAKTTPRAAVRQQGKPNAQGLMQGAPKHEPLPATG